jgi:hypothetical protein
LRIWYGVLVWDVAIVNSVFIGRRHEMTTLSTLRIIHWLIEEPGRLRGLDSVQVLHFSVVRNAEQSTGLERVMIAAGRLSSDGAPPSWADYVPVVICTDHRILS